MKMNDKEKKQVSKFLSLVLRHEPTLIGISLDEAGFVEVDSLLAAISSHHPKLGVSRDNLSEVVRTNDKQRFEFDQTGDRIRARQGHSIHVDHGLEPVEPPEFLLHGTATRVLDSIRDSGLKKMSRHHVHMHSDESTAKDVGSRHGKPALLRIRSGRMFENGFEFFVTANGVWLTDHVPPEFIEFPE